MKGEREKESFGFDTSTRWNKIDIFGLVSVGKYSNLDKKLIRFVLTGILSTIAMPPTPNHHYP